MNDLPPWANGPFELLVHAEDHLINGDDFDRRIALISYDNAIEVAITIYLTLNPMYHRKGRSYDTEKKNKWLKNYHSKLEFLIEEFEERKLDWRVNRNYIAWCHDHRNEQYHGGQKGVPEMYVLNLIREAALWIFSELYDVSDVEQRLGIEIERRSTPTPPQSNEKYDEAIDGTYDVVIFGEQIYSASEILFAVDEAAYYEVGSGLCEDEE